MKYTTAVVVGFFLAAFSPGAAEDIAVDWTIRTYDDATAKVGDRITFSWVGTHNVAIHPTKDCTETDAIMLGETSPVTYIFTGDDVGEIVFACDVGPHCESGQIVKYNVMENVESIEVDWDIPTSGQPYPDGEAKVGDTITFSWDGTHNVAIHPTKDCTEMDAVMLGETSPVTYTFMDDDVGEIVFACDVGSHCELGQRVKYVVTSDAPSDSSAPTEADSPPPTSPTASDSATPTTAPTTAAPTSAASSVSMLTRASLVMGAALIGCFMQG